MADLTITRGDDYIYDGAVTLSGVAVDITGCSIYFTVKRNKQDADADALFTKSLSNNIGIISAVGGTFEVRIRPDDTDQLTRQFNGFYDCVIVDATGRVYTVADGAFIVELDVTQSNP